MLNLNKKSYCILGIVASTLIIGGYFSRNHIANGMIYCKNKICSSYKSTKSQELSLNTFNDFLSSSPPSNSALIFEPNNYHHECLPGYAKYLVDLGYSVEVLIKNGNEDSLELFEPKDKVKVFFFDDLDEISKASNEVALKLKEYSLALLQSTDPDRKELIEKMGFLDNPHTLFIAHDTNYIKKMGMQDYFNQSRVLTLGEFEEGIYVNPHYFGNTPKKAKNYKTRFFITSTSGRNYESLINAASKLKEKNLEFEIIVTGRSENFGANSLPENLKDNFSFKYNLKYSQMYEEIKNSDFIIMSLDPENSYDNMFKNYRCTGTAQLVYGFLKPAIVHKDFAEPYKFNSENSLLHSGSDIEEALEKAVRMKSREYVKKRRYLEKTSKQVYSSSLKNFKKIISRLSNFEH